MSESQTPGDWPESIPYPHYSGLDRHRRCAQAWAYSEVHRLETDRPESTAVLRELGSWWHAVRAVDAVRRGAQLDSLRYVPEQIEIGSTHLILRNAGPGEWYVDSVGSEGRQVTCSADVIELADEWWLYLPAEVEDEWIDAAGEPLPDALRRMDERWRWRWEDRTAHEVPVAVEVQWQRPLLTAADVPDGVPAPVMQGTADEVYLDVRRNLLVIRDHKSHKALNQTAVDDLMDSQLQVYAWGLVDQISEWGLAGYSLAVAYDRTRTAPPKTPVVTKSGTLSKSVTDYDLLTYRKWAESGPEFPGLKKDGSGAGTYAAEERVVETLSAPTAMDQWNRRTLTPLNVNVVRSHLRAARETWRQTVETTRLVQEVGEAPRSLSRSNCSFCDYASLCRAQMTAGPDWGFDPAEHGLRPKS